MTIISKSEWLRRYAAHMLSAGGVTQQFADEAAATALQAGQADDHNTPEEAADDELSHWTNDEGSID